MSAVTVYLSCGHNFGENMDERKFAIILAAGLGKRMNSDLPKVLHLLGGKPLLGWVLDAVLPLAPEKIVVVVGHKHNLVIEYIEREFPVYATSGQITFAHQTELLGTADAVRRALPHLPDSGRTFVLCGDVPLIRPGTLAKLFDDHIKTGSALSVISAHVPNPEGYGRIIRNTMGEFLQIIEHRDATPEQQAIDEINSGNYVFDIAPLREEIEKISNINAQREFYLTDAVERFRERKLGVCAQPVGNFLEILGINSQEDLLGMETFLKATVGGHL